MTASFLATYLTLFSALVPARMWFAPSQPLEVKIDSADQVRLVMREFGGSEREPMSPEATIINGGQTVDLRTIYPQALSVPGTYVVEARPVDETSRQILGTPLVVDVRADRREGAPVGPMVVRVSPLQYAVIQTDQGPIEVIFYYNSAPATVDSFLRLAREGFYDGLTFHRIVPDFVIQGGDPRGDGSGGPGFSIPAEFNDRPHREGVLSMARQGDPNERSGAMPRPQFANSAGSQFFICLNYDRTRSLDGRYTAFGEVVQGMDIVHKIAQAEIENRATGRPKEPQRILKIEVHNVTADHDPYDVLRLELENILPTTQPQEQ